MNDLIDRGDVIEAIDCVDWYHQNQSGEMVQGANPDKHQAWYKAEDIYKAIEAVPVKRDAKKVQELVRCKDCKHYEIYELKKDGTDDRRYKPSYCTIFRFHPAEDWFCADGERRGE